jgi:hypothetical protein
MADIARPRTRNPKLHHLTEELETSFQEAHPPTTTAEENYLRQSGSFSHNNEGVGEVLWSETGAFIPGSQLARPPTSNPRYVRDMSTPLRGDTPPQVPAAIPASQSPVHSETSDSHRRTSRTVLWAADSTELDPGLVARPITSNPWLARVIDSNTSNGSPTMSNASTTKNATTPSAAAKLHHNASEIIWSSGDVEDWRLLARPHAANPVYEAAADDSQTPEGDEVNQHHSRRVSEVLWKRDETADEMVESQRVRIEELEQEVSLLRAQLLQNGLTPVTTRLDLQRAQRAPPQVPPEEQPLLTPIHSDRSPTSPRGQEEEADGHIVDDDTPDEEVDPHLREGGVTPPTARQGKDSSFVKRYAFGNQGARPGTAQPSGRSQPARPQPHNAVASSTTLPQKAASASSTLNVSRPQSAPVHRPTAGSRTGAFMSSFNGFAYSIATNSMAREESDAMTIEYNKLRRPGAAFVEKAEFHYLYKQRAADYGVVVSDRQVERLLAPYNSQGVAHLTLAEFSILYLKLAQW